MRKSSIHKAQAGKFLVLLLPAFCLLSMTNVSATDLTLTGSWLVTIDEQALQSGAGSDIIDPYEGIGGEVVLNVSNYNGAAGWRIFIRRDNLDWPAGVILKVRRATPGAGGSVNGGTEYQEVTTSDNTFLTGSGNVVRIELQFQLCGLSVSMLPDSFSTQLTYTIEDL